MIIDSKSRGMAMQLRQVTRGHWLQQNNVSASTDPSLQTMQYFGDFFYVSERSGK